jgi:formyl-CoA transferase
MPARISAWSVYDVFTVAEGEQLFVAATSDRQFQALCRVLERPDLAGDPELATNAQRVAVRARLVETLAATFASQRKDELAAKLEAAGLPYAPIARPEQLVEDPHLVANGSIVPIVAEDGAATRTVLLPFTLDGRRPGVRRPLPRVGEHTAEVLTDLERRRGARTTSGEGDGD